MRLRPLMRRLLQSKRFQDRKMAALGYLSSDAIASKEDIPDRAQITECNAVRSARHRS